MLVRVQGLARSDADRADLVLGHMAAAAKQRQDPARVGVLAATDVEAEPGAVVERLAARAALAGLVRAAFAFGSLAMLAARRWAVVDQILRRDRKSPRLNSSP